MQKTYLLVGGSQGIGLELIKKLSEAGHRVIALSRTTGGLEALPGVEHVVFDVLNEAYRQHRWPRTAAKIDICSSFSPT